jgi:integrase
MPTGDLIFPWPQTTVSLQRYRKKLLAMAGISEERWFGFHGLRKAIGTEVWKMKPTAAQAQLGHEDLATTRKSYVNPDVLGVALAAELGPTMRRVRQPKSPSPQQLLF